MKLEFSRQIFEKSQISNFIKIRSVGAELLHADGRTDMTKLIVTFRNSGNAPKMQQISLLPKNKKNEFLGCFSMFVRLWQRCL
jgi:hypothetical protein